MLGNNQDLLNRSIDYLECFEGIPEEVLIWNIYPSSNHQHNNSSQLQLFHIYMMVKDTDLQHHMDQTVGVGLKTFKILSTKCFINVSNKDYLIDIVLQFHFWRLATHYLHQYKTNLIHICHHYHYTNHRTIHLNCVLRRVHCTSIQCDFSKSSNFCWVHLHNINCYLSGHFQLRNFQSGHSIAQMLHFFQHTIAW